MLSRIAQLFNTVKHLKVKQVRYQLLYRLNKPGRLTAYEQPFKTDEINLLSFEGLPPVFNTADEANCFEFLNLKVEFKDSIDWNYQEHGKLWNYNLQYANYLLQENISLSKRLEWLKSLHQWLQLGKLPVEPYPVSLQSINTIRLLCHERMLDTDILRALHAEINFLYLRPEYHLLGNHLLENAFALMMGGAFFANEAWIAKAQHLLQTELEEQVLEDGAHFELSPMYHQIILFRLLELLDWYSKWEEKKTSFEGFLRGKAMRMVSWLQHMTFANGDIPHFNDSAEGISYSSTYLLQYASTLGIEADKKLVLSDSGYRKFSSGRYECVVDAAEIGPSYQPGHGHADALSFILYADGKPLLVEWGTSTYQPGERRTLERSSAAHNTLVIAGRNQSQVWSTFRVGNRARVTIEQDEVSHIRASHDGYKKFGITHVRQFDFAQNIVITDQVLGNKSAKKIVYFCLHPDRIVNFHDNVILIDDAFSILFDGAISKEVKPYKMAAGYNTYKEGCCVAVEIESTLTTNISFK